ncbi:MAG: hypothetical protein ABI550_09075, partial [Ignavibacteriaceae bacterium]
NIIQSSIELEYNLKYAKDVIKKIKLRYLEDERNEKKKDPSLVMEVYELTKKINDLKKSV